jgi:ribonuclease HI
MKKLKLDHDLATLVLAGEKTSTWRLFDDKELSVNDVIELVDKVQPDKPQTWQVIGTASIDSIIEKRLRDITAEDMKGHEAFNTTDEMLATYKRYYGPNVTMDTSVKIIHFSFQPNGNESEEETAPMRVEKIKAFADGGSRGNPGPSASGYVLLDMDDKVLVDKGVYLGITTNNQAEYTALKLALEEAKKMGAHEVEVYMDSMLVVNQMKGVFKVRNRDLWPLHDAVKQLTTAFRHITFTHVPRELNKLADAAVNRALDEQRDSIKSQKLS